jgi:putative flavoprotein involved in K+ transport
MSISSVTETTLPVAIAEGWVTSMSEALASGRPDAIAALFVEDGWWRDVVALSWDIRTLHGRPQIGAFLESSKPSSLHDLTLAEDPAPISVDMGPNRQVVQAFFSLRTAVGYGLAIVRLVECGGEWLAWTLMTSLQELTGRELAIGHNREVFPRGTEAYGQRRVTDASFLESDPIVLVIGAGQAGLGIAAHLTLMGIPNLIVERNKRVGDNWRKRYENLVLHDPVWQDSLPFMPFPDSWPVWTPKDKLADWFESYVAAMELNVWTGAELLDSVYSDSDGVWTVRVREHEGNERLLKPRHVVLATGTLNEPNAPDFPGREEFDGTVLHSSQFDTGAEWAGEKAVVIGVCNSGQDIARDLAEHDADVTMIQRSPIYVLSQKRGRAVQSKGSPYAQDGPPTELADLMTLSMPILLSLELSRDVTRAVAEADKEMIEGLKARGFLIDDGIEAGGTLGLAYRRGGGFMLDVGSTDLIIDGTIKIATGSVQRLTPKGVLLDDGNQVDADVVVLATGYKNMRESARKILGDAVANRFGEVWGLDDEGEVRNMWRPSGHPGLWFTGGALVHSRIFSRYLALQIAAAVDELA